MDEFLHCDPIHDFVSRFPNVDGIRLNWRVFGDCGQTKFEDRPVYDRFQIPSTKDCKYNDTLPNGVYEPYHVKTLYHKTFKPAEAQVHQILVMGGLFVNAVGQHENGLSPFQKCDWNGAFIDHFLTKSCEEWCERRLNKIDATGNKIDNDKLIRWYFNLNERTLEKEQIINSYLKDGAKE